MALHSFFYRLFYVIAFFTFLLLPVSPGAITRNIPVQNLPLCTVSPEVSQILSLTSKEDWSRWIRQLSGSEAVQIRGEYYRITTRYSSALFSGNIHAQAYEYIRQWLLLWYPKEWIAEQSFQFSGETWKNLILTIPGSTHPEEFLLATAHLDSISPDPLRLAPGAEDNASGVATLLEMARIFRHYRFDRTIRLIWFTGEEQGLIGSKAYVRDYGTSGVAGVLNFDMFGYDQDGDGCFEIHTGTLPQSKLLGKCMVSLISAYNLNLKTDLIDGYNMTFSDHASFWETGIPAIEVLENHFYNAPTSGCAGKRDQNPNYHTIHDTIEEINLPVGFAIAQAGIATMSSLAGVESPCFQQIPHLQVRVLQGLPHLEWTEVEHASHYRLLHAHPGCYSTGNLITETPLLHWEGSEEVFPLAGYMVEAISPEGCTSFPSHCVWASSAFQQKNPVPTKR
ncbi:M28 family metallopeptidase [Anaerolinea sp.]|uniref:M28 family metallopeptidase n=1 Tax=Anaerolinea sp. TaxID=1872519 RepID=UPI002ACE8647|nr:M28 family metallopeptidase [Anaerolinea sp.]